MTQPNSTAQLFRNPFSRRQRRGTRHLEQMNDRDWWLGVGNGDDYWHVNVHIDREGQAHVQMEKQ